MNANPRIYILIGPPGSGKSTWRERHLAAHPDRATIILSSDDLIDEEAAAKGITYSEAFRSFDHKQANATLHERFQAAILGRCDVVVDRTNMSVKSRRRFLSSVPKHYEKIAVVFQVSRSELDERLKRREQATGKGIPASVVDEMIANYQMPEIGEFHHVEYLGDAVAAAV